MARPVSRLITIGRISGVYGVQGWVKVYSYTEPRENILKYTPWRIRRAERWETIAVPEGRRHGKGVIARLEGCADREAARALIGADIAVERGRMGDTAPGEFYWADLVGLEVINREGVALGRVDHLIETGANDVLVVADDGRERLIPFVPDLYIDEVDLEGGRMVVDWAPED